MFNRSNNNNNAPTNYSGRPDPSKYGRDPARATPSPARRENYDNRMSGNSYSYDDETKSQTGYGNERDALMGRGGDYNSSSLRTVGTARSTSGQTASGAVRTWSLQPGRSPSDEITYGNIVAVSPQDFQLPRPGQDLYLLLNNLFVLSARPVNGFPQGQISLSLPQRSWTQVSLTDRVEVQVYDPLTQGSHIYLGAMDLTAGFASQSKQPLDIQFDQEELSHYFIKNFQNQLFAPGQQIIMDFKSIKLLFTVRGIQLVDMIPSEPGQGPTLTNPQSRGILTNKTPIVFHKDAKSLIKLSASKHGSATKSIMKPNFRFEDMGIGGLDKEFGDIFRRAFNSRIFSQGVIDEYGIQHVRGILLYGPPGTGKTLIARQIGKMLNAREPKIINGPEVLNKYVGQSEENIRKMFADAEKEYKEKGDESELHPIIFDELDAVCKQRGSGAGGGTGVGDSVVNQLLSKLDGVDQLNNILLIGMTNRMDMIDDALLRPGRLEVHMEISLPDEHGRQQILKIHTQTIRKNNRMDPDVDLAYLAHRTKNFSGAEIGGLVRSAASFSMNRHTQDGTRNGLKDVASMKINSQDFENALEEVKAAFGASEEALGGCISRGIIHFSPFVADILEEGRSVVDVVQNSESTRLASLLLHGPSGSGKTALAATIALDSNFPFIKLVSPEAMVGFNEMQKVQYLDKVFRDAYKSPLNIVVIDNIEGLIDYTAVGPRFSNAVLQTLSILLTKKPEKERRLLIIATTSQRSVLRELGIYDSFDYSVAVPNVRNHQELAVVLRESDSFPEDEQARAIKELGEVTGNDEVGVGIKKILMCAERAKRDQDDRPARFAQVLANVIGERKY
ncbi:MAG: transport between ER and Golgi ATPase protein [Trizodia sp. TS-e1964]|nr:MAG: transport between ER and Golgi ATPase protein [Trizodia sp. TS-e1964]